MSEIVMNLFTHNYNPHHYATTEALRLYHITLVNGLFAPSQTAFPDFQAMPYLLQGSWLYLQKLFPFPAVYRHYPDQFQEKLNIHVTRGCNYPADQNFSCLHHENL